MYKLPCHDVSIVNQLDVTYVTGVCQIKYFVSNRVRTRFLCFGYNKMLQNQKKSIEKALTFLLKNVRFYFEIDYT